MTDQTDRREEIIQNAKDDPSYLGAKWYKANLGASGYQASVLEDAFLTDEQLFEALEADEDLTEYDGIGQKTASLVSEWYDSFGEVAEPDGTLVLDDEGLHMPDWLVSFVGTFRVETPNLTIRPSTTDLGVPEVSDVLGTYPSDGIWNLALTEGQIGLSRPGHPVRIYDIDDQRTERTPEEQGAEA